MHFPRQAIIVAGLLLGSSGCLTPVVLAQSVASGTVEGSVTDPSGGVVAGANVEIRNPFTGVRQTAKTDSSVMFRLTNVPFNRYHIEATQSGFAVAAQDVNVRTTVPVTIMMKLALAGVTESVTVEGAGQDILENVSFAHADVDLSTLEKLPTLSPASGLSDAIMLSSPGVVADSNGFFHPLGDHAQTSFSVDNQPISDQQSKTFSTQLPPNAVQSLEVITGATPAEYGDKTSLVINAITKSGLNQKKPT